MLERDGSTLVSKHYLNGCLYCDYRNQMVTLEGCPKLLG